MFEGMNVVQILQIGVIGLGFLLAVLSYHLLTKEQSQETPRSVIIKPIYVFMFFSVVLCVIGLISQIGIFDFGQKESNVPNKFITDPGNEKKILYNYFVYSDDSEGNHLCNISEFEFSENMIDNDTKYIQGKITGKILVDNNHINFENFAFGYKNQYYLKITHDQGVAFLEHKRGDYVGYWIGEADDPDVRAVICPLIFSPSTDGLVVEEAKLKWPILNEPCRALSSLKEIL